MIDITITRLPDAERPSEFTPEVFLGMNLPIATCATQSQELLGTFCHAVDNKGKLVLFVDRLMANDNRADFPDVNVTGQDAYDDAVRTWAKQHPRILRLRLDYPLNKAVAYELRLVGLAGFMVVSVGDLVWAIAQAYALAYADEKAANGAWHGLGDLYLEGIRLDLAHGIMQVVVGS